jgi:transposase InsO family protein
MNYQFDSDTADLSRYSSYNNGYKYILVVIDVFSKFVWTEPLKTKTSGEMIKALKTIFERAPRPLKFRTDRGTEYCSKSVKSYFKTLGLEHFVTQNLGKSNYAERVIKTLRSRIAQYSNWKQTHQWIDVLPEITRSYNNTFHRSIKQSPASVTEKDNARLWQLQYDTLPRPARRRSPVSEKF